MNKEIIKDALKPLIITLLIVMVTIIMLVSGRIIFDNWAGAIGNLVYIVLAALFVRASWKDVVTYWYIKQDNENYNRVYKSYVWFASVVSVASVLIWVGAMLIVVI